MAVQGLATLAVALCILLSAVNAQTPAGEGNCAVTGTGAAGGQANSGPSFLPSRNCDSFYQCDSAQKAIPMACPQNLCFSSVNLNCDWPRSTANSMCNCTGAAEGTGFPHSCCGMAHVCRNGVMNLENCTSSTSNIPSCAANCVDAKLTCNRPSSAVNNAPNCSSYQPMANNECQFQQLQSNGASVTNQCAAGTGWNQTLCTCTSNSRCSNATTNYAPQLKALNSQCLRSFQAACDSTNVAPRGTSEKAQGFSVYIDYGPAIFNNAVASLGPQGMTCPHFYNNDLSQPFGITVCFRVTASSGQNILILSNASGGKCARTLEITGQISGNSIGLTLIMVGVTNSGQPNQIYSQTQQTLTLPQATGDFICVSVLFDGTAMLRAANLGSNADNANPSFVNSPPSGIIGTKFAFTACPWTVLAGGGVDFKRMNVREGCGDMTKVGL